MEGVRRTAMSDLEERLYGGNVADSVVRVGATVRKPMTAATSSVEAFLEHLFETGFGGAPRTLGRDEKGRHVLEYVPGATEQPFSYTNDELVRVGRLIREFHAAALSFVPPVGAQWLVAIKPDSGVDDLPSRSCAVESGARWRAMGVY